MSEKKETNARIIAAIIIGLAGIIAAILGRDVIFNGNGEPDPTETAIAQRYTEIALTQLALEETIIAEADKSLTPIPTVKTITPEEYQPQVTVDVPDITDTHTSIVPTSTFTQSPTHTITPTPTIAPTGIVVGPDNLPLKFVGIYDEDVYAPTTFILYIEERSGDRVSGKLHYPDRFNTFIGWEGNIIHDFGDIIEQSKWEYVEGYGSEGGTWVKETRRWEITGALGMGGLNYFYISDTGRLTGVHFFGDICTPIFYKNS